MDDNNDDLFAEVRRIMDGAKSALATDQEEAIIVMARTCESAWSDDEAENGKRDNELFVATIAPKDMEADPDAITLDPSNLRDLEDQSDIARLAVQRAMGTDDYDKFIPALVDLNATIAMEDAMDPVMWVVRTQQDYGTFSVYIASGGVLFCRNERDGDFQTFWCEWEDNHRIVIPNDLTDAESRAARNSITGFVTPKQLRATFPRTFSLMAMEANSNIRDHVMRNDQEDDDN
jgi:hypothetical protein